MTTGKEATNKNATGRQAGVFDDDDGCCHTLRKDVGGGLEWINYPPKGTRIPDYVGNGY